MMNFYRHSAFRISCSLTLLFIFFTSISVVKAQQVPSVQTQSTQKRDSDITFETEDTLSHPDPDEYELMPLPGLDTTDQASLTEEQQEEFDRAVHKNLKTGERSIQSIPRQDDPPQSETKPGFNGIPLEPSSEEGSDPQPEERIEKSGSGENTIQTFNSLSRVNQPATDPWRQNVKLFISFPGGNRQCSGALIDYEWVLTAGHCVHKDDLGGFANSIAVAPGFNSGNRPYGTVQVNGITTLQGWTDNDNFNYDIAWVRLDNPVGFKTGFFGTGYDSDNSFFYNNDFENPGYPGGSFSNGQVMYTSNGTFDSQFWRTETRALYQDSRSYKGQSGSGVYRTNGSPRIQYGTLSSGNNNWTRFARINQNRFNMINDDIADARPSNPDLVALDVKSSQNRFTEGDHVQDLSFILANRANVNANDSWDIEVYLSDDRDISTSDTHLSTQTLNTTIGAESYKKINMNPVSIPIGVSGTKYIGVIVDADDANTDNNDTDDTDAKEITITPSHTATITSNNPSSGVEISVKKQDNRGDEDGVTSLERRYAEGETFEVGAPLFAGTNEFEQWNKNGSKHSENQVVSVTMGTSDVDLTAEYSIPDIPVKPYRVDARLPENETEVTKTRTIKVVNEHSTTLDWTAGESAEWLSLSPSSGSTAPGDSTAITVTFNTENTSQGSYSEDITFSSGDFGVDDNIITANLRAGRVPATAPSPEEIYKYQELADNELLFGMAVDGDPLGNYVGMGTPGLGDGNSGGCPILRWVDGRMTMDQMVTPAEQIDGTRFGQAVDVFTAGGVPMAMIGAPGSPGIYKTTASHDYGGRIHLFARGETDWTELSSDVPDLAGADGSRFGAAMDAEPVPGSGESEYFVAVGSPGADFEGFSNIGLVFVYRVTSSGMEEPVAIYPDIYDNGMNMGYDVSLTTRGDRTLLAVGVPARDNAEKPGHTLLYEYDGETWNQEQLVEAVEIENPDTSPHFGSAVAFNWSEENPALAVGMPGATVEEEGDGMIQTFRYSFEQESWVPAHPLTAEKAIPGAGLGESLTIQKTSKRIVLIAGAPGIKSSQFGGEALVYQKPDAGDEWQHRGTLTTEELDSNSSLGRAVSILPVDGELRYLTGAPGHDGEFEDEGSTFEFNVPDPLTLPAFELGTRSFEDGVQEDDSTTQSFAIQNTGKAELTWDLVGTIPNWLNIEKRTGAIPAGESDEINVQFNTTELDTGTYSTSLQFEANEAGRDALPVEFELTVTDRVEIDLVLTDWMSRAKDTIRAGGQLSLDEQEVYVYNQGADPVDSLFHVGLYAAPDSSMENATLISSVSVESHPEEVEGTALDFSPAARVPEELGGGSVYLAMVADYENKVPETDETNNRLWHSVHAKEAEHAMVEYLTDISGLQVTVGQDETVNRDITFANNGEDTLNFTIPGFDEGGELSLKVRHQKPTSRDSVPLYIRNVEPRSGHVAVGDTGSVTLTLSGDDVAADTYQDTLEVVTNDPDRRSTLIPLEVVIRESTSLEDQEDKPEKFALKSNYPNPFNPSTRIRYDLPETSNVRLQVYDILGRRVTTLVDEQQQAGRYEVTFDASHLSSGSYIYRIKAGDYTETRQMMLIK